MIDFIMEFLEAFTDYFIEVCLLDKNAFSYFRCQSTSCASELDSSRLEVRQAGLSKMKPKPPVNKLAFGKVFTDHMLTIDWTKSHGWASPQITPFENFSIHPGAKVIIMNTTIS